MQLGTLAAVFVFFWNDLIRMTAAIWHDLQSFGRRGGAKSFSLDTKLAFAIILGTVPVAVLGFALKHVIEGAFTKSIEVIVFS